MASPGILEALDIQMDYALDLPLTDQELAHLVELFEAGILPRKQWTHQTHLAVAVWYVAHHPLAEATHRIRQGIQAYNQAVGIVTTEQSGYHETITLFYVWLIHAYLSHSAAGSSVIDRLQGLITCYGDKKLPLEFYNRDRLMSTTARFTWVDPDLKPLTFPGLFS